MRTRNHAFTLIELLVVIAIIAILAAILFPVFAQAKATAKHTQNLSHIRQFGMAALMYAGDNEDKIWTQLNHDQFDDDSEYSILLKPYTKNFEIVYDVNRTKTGCSSKRPTQRCVGFAPNFGVYSYRSGTGLFEIPYGETINNEGGSVWPGRAMTSFPSPAELVLLVTTADSNMYTNSYYYQDVDGHLKTPRGDGRYVRVFVDGHASTVRYGAYAYGARYIQMPIALKDANYNCRDLDAIDAENLHRVGPNIRCEDANILVMSRRTPW